MALIESLIGPVASIIDKIIPDKEARAKAKLELIRLEGTQELKQIETRLCSDRRRGQLDRSLGPAAPDPAFSM